jgi:uncharacterized membrane protein
MTLLTLFTWCDQTALAAALRDSTWLFPVIETLHLLSLALLGGAVLLVDLRLLGIGLRAQPVDRLAAATRPWLFGSLAVIVGSGVLLFMSEAMKCYANPAFWLKMAFLAVAVVFTLTVRSRVLARDDWRSEAAPRLVAIVSIVLWTGVGITGRGIGFW